MLPKNSEEIEQLVLKRNCFALSDSREKTLEKYLKTTMHLCICTSYLDPSDAIVNFKPNAKPLGEQWTRTSDYHDNMSDNSSMLAILPGREESKIVDVYRYFRRKNFARLSDYSAGNVFKKGCPLWWCIWNGLTHAYTIGKCFSCSVHF